MYLLYILHSNTKIGYYVGFTGDDLSERLRRHNSNHKGFTGEVADWIVVYTETFTNKSKARERELEIKAWKSRQKIKQLIHNKSTL